MQGDYNRNYVFKEPSQTWNFQAILFVRFRKNSPEASVKKQPVTQDIFLQFSATSEVFNFMK